MRMRPTTSAIVLVPVRHIHLKNFILREPHPYCDGSDCMVTPAVQPKASHGIQVSEVILIWIWTEPIKLHNLDVVHIELIGPLYIILSHKLAQDWSSSGINALHLHVHQGMIPKVPHSSRQIGKHMRPSVDVVAFMHGCNGIGAHFCWEISIRIQSHRVFKLLQDRLQEDRSTPKTTHASISQGPFDFFQSRFAAWILHDELGHLKMSNAHQSPWQTSTALYKLANQSPRGALPIVPHKAAAEVSK